MIPSDLHRLGTLIISCAALAACQSREEGKQASPARASSSGAATASAFGPLAPRRELEPDPAFSAELERVAASCTFLQKHETLSCPSAQVEPLKTKIDELGPVALETLLATVFDGAPAVATLAATQMRNAYERSLGPALEKAPVPERVVSAMIEALEELPLMNALRVAPAATFVAAREGQLQAIIPIMERRVELRNVMLPRVMRYSRLRAFAEVRRWAGAADEDTVLSALEALRLMDDWTDAERGELGPWLKGFLTHESNRVRGKAAGFLLDCGDERAAGALRWFEAASAGRQLKRDTIFAFGRRCHPDNHAKLGAEQLAQLASSPLCAKIEKLVDRVAADEGSESELRGAALETLSAIWPKTALRRARTLTKNSDPRLAQMAQNVIKIAGDDKAK